MIKNDALMKRLEQLDGEVVLGLKMEKITKIVPKSPERHWLGEILDNVLSLFYVTMWGEWLTPWLGKHGQGTVTNESEGKWGNKEAGGIEALRRNRKWVC